MQTVKAHDGGYVKIKRGDVVKVAGKAGLWRIVDLTPTYATLANWTNGAAAGKYPLTEIRGCQLIHGNR